MSSFATNETTVNELIANAMTRMTALWDEIGTPQSDRESVENGLKLKLAECVREVESNETSIRDSKLAQIKQSREEYNKKASMLQKSSCDVEDTREGENLTDAVLRTGESLSMINEEFEKVLVVHESLLEELQSLYKTLADDCKPQFESIGDVLSEERKINLQLEIQDRSTEKANRIESRQVLINEWDEFIDELCLSPEDNDFDTKIKALHDVMNHAETPQLDVELPIGLTIVDIAAVGDRVTELSKLREERLQTITALGKQITELWQKLEVPQQERDDFFSDNDGLGVQQVAACQEELARLTALKKERVRPMMLTERSHIVELWEKLHFSTEQKSDFASFAVDEENFTEEMLEEHEAYHKKLSEQYTIQEPIMANIEKREKILTFPSKMKDPMPKKGELKDDGKKYSSGDISKMNMKRAKMASMVKRLPKLDLELLVELKQWKETYGFDIAIDGKVYMHVIEEAMEDRENAGKAVRNKLKEQHMAKFESAPKKQSTLRRKTTNAKR